MVLSSGHERPLRNGDFVKVRRTDNGCTSASDGGKPNVVKVDDKGAILQQRLKGKHVGQTVRINGRETPRRTEEILHFHIMELVRES